MVHAKRVAANIDRAVAPGGQLVGKPGFHRRMRRSRRLQQRGPERPVIRRPQFVRHLSQGRIVERWHTLGKCRLKRLDPAAPLLDPVAAGIRGPCGIHIHAPSPMHVILRCYQPARAEDREARIIAPMPRAAPACRD